MRFLVLGLLFLSFAAQADSAKPLHVVTGMNKPPFIADENAGFIVDIVNKAFEGSNIEVKFIPVPYARILSVFENDDQYAAADGITEEFKKDKYCNSDSHFELLNMAISLKNRDFPTFQSGADFAALPDGSRIEAFQNAKLYLGDEYLSGIAGDNILSYRETSHMERIVKKLLTGRNDLTIMDTTIFDYQLTQLARDNKFKNLVRNSEIAKSKIVPATQFHMVFKDEKLCKLFNAGLERIRANGDYEKLYKKWTDVQSPAIISESTVD